MKNLLFAVFALIFSSACQQKNHPVITMPTEKYKLVAIQSEGLAELKKQVGKSKVEIEIDFKSGDFKGVYKKVAFAGKYDIKKVTSGLVKGFNYKVELAYLSKDNTEDTKLDRFIEQLAKCEQIFVSPDRLIDTQFVMAEFKTSDESKNLQFVVLK
jgi:hypothetical protein